MVKFKFTNEEFKQSSEDLFKFTKTWYPSDEEAQGDDEVISDEEDILAYYELMESPVLIYQGLIARERNAETCRESKNELN